MLDKKFGNSEAFQGSKKYAPTPCEMPPPPPEDGSAPYCLQLEGYQEVRSHDLPLCLRILRTFGNRGIRGKVIRVTDKVVLSYSALPLETVKSAYERARREAAVEGAHEGPLGVIHLEDNIPRETLEVGNTQLFEEAPRAGLEPA